MRIGFAGSGPHAAFAARRLAAQYTLRTFDASGKSALPVWSSEHAPNASELAGDSDIIILCSSSVEEQTSLLFGANGLEGCLTATHAVVEIGAGDPDQTREYAERLARKGTTLIDAPLHTEDSNAIDEASALLVGGPRTVFESVQPVLRAICPKVIYCGDAGNGHATHLVVAAIAACNRLITYECAAMGSRNGLTVQDMATVLNKSSGYNSASARVLPALASGGQTSDVALSVAAGDLSLASRVAMRHGAPMLIATLVRSTLDAAANRLGADQTIDELATIWESDAGLQW